jgi:hypothetical protein
MVERSYSLETILLADKVSLTVSITSDEQNVRLYSEVANLISITPEV